VIAVDHIGWDRTASRALAFSRSERARAAAARRHAGCFGRAANADRGSVMTRLLSFAGIALLGAAAGVLVMRPVLARDHRREVDRRLAALQEQTTALEAETDRLGRALGRSMARDLVGARAPAAEGPAPAAATGKTPSLSPAGEAANVSRRNAEVEQRRQQYFASLDESIRQGAPAPAVAATMHRNLEALRALPKERPSGFDFGEADCTDSLCRIEAKRTGPPDPASLSRTARLLQGGMSALTMRLIDADRVVFYTAPTDHRLPAPNL
jgi:hypothetical protein